MTRHKTDFKQLARLSAVLENWCDENQIEYHRCSTYQWNVKVPEVNVLLSVYPGSGVIWVPYAHYDDHKTTDQSFTKVYFNDKEAMIGAIEKIIFAGDAS